MACLMGGMVGGSAAHAQAQRPELEYASAAIIRDTCLKWATERNLSVSIAVFDRHGTMVTQAHMDDAPVAVAAIAQWKGKSAATMHVSTGETAKWGGSAPQIANWQGGLPFFTKGGAPLGGIGVSGAQSDEDDACGSAGIAAAGMIAAVGE